MPCACDTTPYCSECQIGYAIDINTTCPCCGRSGKRLPNPNSIAARCERGEACAKCKVVTHAPKHIRGGKFICNKCG